MEDQNQTNPPAGEEPLKPVSGPEVPPVPNEPVSDTPPTTPTPAAPPVPAVAPAPSYSYAAAPAQETNPWAIVSLIASILSWVGLFGLGGIVGLVAGMVARNQIRDSAGRQGGDGLALAGIILGAANVLISCIAVLCVRMAFAGMFTMPFFFGPNGR